MKLRLVLVLAVLLPLSATAGSEERPDMVDKAGLQDFDMACGCFPLPEIDITAVWVEPGPDVVAVKWQVVDLDHQTLPRQGMVYYLYYGTDEYPWIALVAQKSGLVCCEGWWGILAAANAEGKMVAYLPDLPVVLDFEENTVRLDVPREFANSTLRGPRAVSFHLVSTGYDATSNPTGLLWPSWPRDFVPNGRDARGADIPIS